VLLGRSGMNLTRLLSAPLLFAACTALGCSSEPTIVDAPFTLTSAEVGGFAGVDNRITIDSSAKTITLTKKGVPAGTDTLSDAEITQVTKAIEAADLANPEDYGSGGGGEEAFGAFLTFTMKGQSYETGLGSDAPAEVQSLVKLVDDLSTVHIGSAN
jgi:hypothetical protein